MLADQQHQTTVAAVLARVEAAQGPDRDLDAAIVAALTPGVVGVEREPLAPDARNYLFIYDPPRRWLDSWLPVPRFTASLDASLELVSEDCGWMVMGNVAKVSRSVAQGRSPALALCAAALMARMEVRHAG